MNGDWVWDVVSRIPRPLLEFVSGVVSAQLSARFFDAFEHEAFMQGFPLLFELESVVADGFEEFFCGGFSDESLLEHLLNDFGLSVKDDSGCALFEKLLQLIEVVKLVLEVLVCAADDCF